MTQSRLVDLEAVVAVARLGGFRAAARDLGVSATAVSNAIAAVEGRIGVRLFNRTTRSVALSDAGARFIATVAPALSDIQTAMSQATMTTDSIVGTLRINCSVVVADKIVLPALWTYRLRHPGVTVDLVTDEHLVDIVARGCDAGIRVRDAIPADMVVVPLGGDLRFVVVATPDYLRSRTVPQRPQDLLNHDCIRARWPSGPLYRWEFVQDDRPLSIDVPGTLILDDPLLMRTAALQHAGLAYMWEEHVRRDIIEGRLMPVLQDCIPNSPGLALYHPSRRHVPAALKEFIVMVGMSIDSGVLQNQEVG